MTSRAAPAPSLAYAVHTKSCTYLLDEDGICRRIVAPQGASSSHMRRCINAQFVASLDVRLEGALMAELAAGSHALFVNHTGENMVLLRTGMVIKVDDRRSPRDTDSLPPADVHMSHAAYGRKQASAAAPTARPSFGFVRRQGEETTVTVSFRNIEALTTRQNR